LRLGHNIIRLAARFGGRGVFLSHNRAI
jgi:hypothetical protein